MPHFTTIKARGVGLVEVFRNPSSREWRDLLRIADPIDGIRAYEVEGDLYAWGSLPLHRDLRPWLLPEIGAGAAPWIGVQIAPLLGTVTVTEVAAAPGAPRALEDPASVIERSRPLRRLLGSGFDVRRVESDRIAVPG